MPMVYGIGGMCMYSKPLFIAQKKRKRKTTGPCEKNLSVVKIIVRHVERGICNGPAESQLILPCVKENYLIS